MSAEALAVQSAEQYRAPGLSGGNITALGDVVATFNIIPPMAATPEQVQVHRFNSVRDGFISYHFAVDNVTLPDVAEGDVLVSAGVNYTVKGVSEWPRPEGGSYLELALEVLRLAV